MEHDWYHRFDRILLTPADERSEQEQELHAWLEAFDDTLLGMRGRRDSRRRWCEDAFAAQRVVRELGRLPDASDGSVPACVHAWIAAQPSADLNAFQAAWWDYMQYLRLVSGDAARVGLD